MKDIQTAIDLIRSATRVSVLSGAGISTLCGIADFRGNGKDSFYNNPEKMLTFDIDTFDRDPSIFYRNVRPILDQIFSARPNVVHEMVAKLERVGKVAGVITQNIDHLHQAAGSSVVYEVHGSFGSSHCRRCGKELSIDEMKERMQSEEILRCQCGGVFKPDVTFFGEMLPEAAFDGARRLASESDLMLVLGTSLTVQPAASLPLLTVGNGGKVIIVNAQPTPYDSKAAARYDDLKPFAEAILAAF